jgi:hypothetical protein
LQKINGGELETALLQGLYVRGMVAVPGRCAHKMLAQVISKSQGFKGGIREFVLNTIVSSSELNSHGPMLTLPKNKIIECASQNITTHFIILIY